jgi:hypothetical protein
MNKAFPDGYYIERIGGPVEASVAIPYLRINGKWCKPKGYDLEMFPSFEQVFERQVQKVDSFLELLNLRVSRRDKKDLSLNI